MVPVVDMGCLPPRYGYSSKRLLLLDSEGAVFALLKCFADDPRNEVWLLSGLLVKSV
jgi:hypothetical protein